MKKTIIFAALAIFPLTTFGADYYAQDYDPAFLPYNFQDAIETNYDECYLVLEQYHDISSDLDKEIAVEKQNNSSTDRTNYIVPWTERPFLNDVRVGSFSELKTVTEEAIRQCLVEYREYQEAEEKRKAEEAEKEAERKRIAERLAAIETALEECDSDFFEEEMTTQERMDTYDERMACEEEIDEPVEDSEPVVATPAVVSEQVLPEPIVPQYVPPPGL